ncbi:uncharacterized protein LY79DRAFT_263529 [Colletotrichum navitas]|uniref:Uncharacterized protein n=1 Tax=Colletotrichum navitas TaxID=681940 RepID=A0AAD8V4A4_9PEZI|nr:uncharacterized protein LY79DRAFT_263529 [Colletotrichum navitas]KAK1585685.1 hypothetical protein LY79DRAFT_263529 [Colletotrichum navitas]
MSYTEQLRIPFFPVPVRPQPVTRAGPAGSTHWPTGWGSPLHRDHPQFRSTTHVNDKRKKLWLCGWSREGACFQRTAHLAVNVDENENQGIPDYGDHFVRLGSVSRTVRQEKGHVSVSLMALVSWPPTNIFVCVPVSLISERLKAPALQPQQSYLPASNFLSHSAQPMSIHLEGGQ